MSMKWIGKVTGGLLGALVLGPIGAALGVLLGHQFDDTGTQEETPPLPAEELADVGARLFRASFQVMGYLAKADGRVSEREIDAARALMQELRLDAAQVHEAIACFTAGKQPAYDYRAELTQLAALCNGRPDIARVFLEIQMRAALEGNDLAGPVRLLIARLASALGVSALEVMHIETVLRIRRSGGFRAAGAAGAVAGERELAEAYRVLETSAAASNEEVAKAYRRQLQRHHPDKLKAHGLPESMLAHAKQRTQHNIEAWEVVRERRGIR
jgi:DnaJ like chaperone protein